MYKYIPNYTSRLYKIFRRMTIHPTTSNIIKLITNHNPLNMYRYNMFFKKDHIKEKKKQATENAVSRLKQNNDDFKDLPDLEIVNNNINNKRKKKRKYNNKYYEKKELKKLTSTLCEYCNVPESTEHFILSCRKFISQRKTLYDNIKKIVPSIIFDIPYLLFPFNYYDNNDCIKIWEEISKFVETTKRFKKDFNEPQINDHINNNNND